MGTVIEWLAKVFLWFFLAGLLLALPSCEGTIASPPQDTCGGWQEEPTLLGAWRSVDFEPAAEFVLTEDSIRYGNSQQTFAYAVCTLSGEPVLMVNDVELPYFLAGDRLTLGGRLYARQ